MRLRDREFVLDLGIEVRDHLEEEQGLQGSWEGVEGVGKSVRAQDN